MTRIVKNLVLCLLALALLGTASAMAEQTEFNIISAISALSGGYEDNPVLNAMQEQTGIKINWDCMSDSLSEQSTSASRAATCRTPSTAWASTTMTC